MYVCFFLYFVIPTFFPQMISSEKMIWAWWKIDICTSKQKTVKTKLKIKIKNALVNRVQTFKKNYEKKERWRGFDSILSKTFKPLKTSTRIQEGFSFHKLCQRRTFHLRPKIYDAKSKNQKNLLLKRVVNTNVFMSDLTNCLNLNRKFFGSFISSAYICALVFAFYIFIFIFIVCDDNSRAVYETFVSMQIFIPIKYLMNMTKMQGMLRREKKWFNKWKSFWLQNYDQKNSLLVFWTENVVNCSSIHIYSCDGMLFINVPTKHTWKLKYPHLALEHPKMKLTTIR